MRDTVAVRVPTSRVGDVARRQQVWRRNLCGRFARMTCVFPSKRVRRALAGIIVAAAAGCAGAAPTEPGSPPAELQALPRPLTSSEQRVFDAEVRALSFSDAPGTLAAVNGWVNDKTHGKIPSILESVDPSDVMYLLNAIYFKGSWRDRFDPRQTRDASFHAADGSTQAAKLMHRQAAMLYGSTSRFQAAALTIVGIGVTSAPAIPTMRVDRPFVFVIRERLSGTVLFMGKITKLPSS